GGNGRVRVGAGRADQAHGRGGGVLLVVGVQDEQQVQRLGHDRVQLQRLARHLEHHVQEAADVVEVVARVADRPADRVAVGGGGQGRHLRQQADGGQAALLRIVQVQGVVVERR